MPTKEALPSSSQEDLTFDLLEQAGFERVLDLPFTGHANRQEHLYVYAHRDGLILKLDTYYDRINAADVYYNWRPNMDSPGWWSLTSSGGPLQPDNIYPGHHDARWGLRHNLDRMRKNGPFASTWTADPFLWLLHYMDTKDETYDYKAINAERLKLLPDWVRAIVGEHGNTK